VKKLRLDVDAEAGQCQSELEQVEDVVLINLPIIDATKCERSGYREPERNYGPARAAFAAAADGP
jgi:hypothetical protein